MNPVFIFIVIIGAAALWAILSIIWIPLGKVIDKKVKEMSDKLNQEDEKETKEE